MKKLLSMLIVVAIASVSSAFAKDNDVKISGTVSAVDSVNKRITIKDIDGKDVMFAVVPSTDIEFKKKMMEHAKFTDLKVGQHVEVQYVPGVTKTNVAEEIDIYLK